MPHRAVVAATLAALGLSAVPAIAQAPRTLVFREIQKKSTFTYVDNPPRSKNPARPRFSAGDFFVISVPLAKGGQSRGSLRAQCTVIAGARDPSRAAAMCTGVITLKEGQLVVVVSTANLDADTTTGAIVGGTRAYTGARGTFSSINGKQGTIDTVTLTG